MSTSYFTCPNPACDFVCINRRYLSQHFNSIRGQHCMLVHSEMARAGTSSDNDGRRRHPSRQSHTPIAIYNYNNNYRHSNYQSLSSLLSPDATTFTREQPDEQIADAATFPDEDEAIPVEDDVDNVDNADIADHMNETAVEYCFTHTNHQRMPAKLLAMLNDWNVPNTCFDENIEWYDK